MIVRALRSEEAGETLAELLVAIAIVGAAMVAIIGGMSTSIIVSDVHRKQATADTVIRSVAEDITNVDQAYSDCAGTSAYAFDAPPAGFTATVTAVAYWDGTSTSPAQFTATCPTPDAGLQRISVRVVSNDGRDTETLDVLKRRK